MSAGFGFSSCDSARRLLWKVANRPVVLVCRIGEQGIGAGSQFSRSSCSYSCSVFHAVDKGIVETMIPGEKRKRGEGSGYSPIQREDEKGEGGYRRVDDTGVMDCWAEEVVLPT